MTGEPFLFSAYYAAMSSVLGASRWIRYVRFEEEPEPRTVTVFVRTWRLRRIPTRWLRCRVEAQVIEAARERIDASVALRVDA